MTASSLIRRGDRDDRGFCGLQHPVRDRDVRALLQDGAPPHVVAPLPRLHLLLHLAPHPHRLLPRRGEFNLWTRLSFNICYKISNKFYPNQSDFHHSLITELIFLDVLR